MSSEQAEKNPGEEGEKEQCAFPSCSPAGLQDFTSVAAAVNDIHVSAERTDKDSRKVEVKLHVKETVWSPTCVKVAELPEEQAKTEELYRKVRGILNRLTPETFQTLMTQVQSLPINNLERLRGVVNLVFDKAVRSEPSFCACYAKICKFLSNIQVPADQKDENSPVCYVQYPKLIVAQCEEVLEKNSEEELNKAERLKEIADCTDSEKKEELQFKFEEESRKVRMKSLGNMRLIGELFKLQMLSTTVMHRCIQLLLKDGEEESLERLCVLLTTVGKDLEVKNEQDLSQYFVKIKQILLKAGQISNRVRFMMQNVIELHENKWVPRRERNKVVDQIQKETEVGAGPSEGNRRCGNKGGGRKKKICPRCAELTRSSVCDIASHGGGDNNQAGLSGAPAGEGTNCGSPEISALASGVPVLTNDQVKKETKVLLDEYFNNLNEIETAESVVQTFGEANISAFVLESLNSVLDKTVVARQNFGKLMCFLIKEKVVTKAVFCTSVSQVVSEGDDLAMDIPKIWLYLAEFIVPLLAAEVISFSEFGSLAKSVGKLVVEVLQLLVKDKGPAWIRERWVAASLNWTHFVDPSDVDSFVKQNKLEFTLGDGVLSQ